MASKVSQYLFEKAKTADAPMYEPQEHTLCPNCNTQVDGAYCPNCGQKKITEEEYSLRHFIGHALHEFTHFDTKFFKSFRDLFLSPGKLTASFIAGKRGSYMTPLSLFIITNVFFFFIGHYIPTAGIFATPLEVHETQEPLYSALASGMVKQKLQHTHESHAAYEIRFNHIMQGEAKSLVSAMVPIFALIVYLLYFRRRKYYVQHLIYSINFYTFFLIAAITLLPLLYILAHIILVVTKIKLTPGDDDLLASAIITLISLVYLYLSARKVYGQNRLATIIKSTVLAISFWEVVVIYRFVLFFTVFYTT